MKLSELEKGEAFRWSNPGEGESEMVYVVLNVGRINTQVMALNTGLTFPVVETVTNGELIERA
jgi:hypothetical protein